MKIYTGKMSRTEFLDYAITHGKAAAADLLLLCGPDGYPQDYDNYQDLMYLLTDGKEGKPMADPEEVRS